MPGLQKSIRTNVKNKKYEIGKDRTINDQIFSDGKFEHEKFVQHNAHDDTYSIRGRCSVVNALYSSIVTFHHI